MSTVEVFTRIENHWALIFTIGIGIMFLLISLFQKLGFYAWYAVVVLVALAVGFLANNFLYFWTFMLGMVTAFAEIISKFGDEPIKSLRTPQAVFYLLLNGMIASFALFLLVLYGASLATPLDQVKMVATAGLGSMLIMRSKLFNVKVGGEDVAFGPEQIIKIFFHFMESAIDRVRAQSRVDFVKSKLRDIDFDKIYQYSLTMLRAPQALEGRDECEKEIMELANGEPRDKQLKSYRLGFLLLNKMGEDFVAELFDNAPPEWRVRAPMPEQKEESFLDKIPFLSTKQELLPYVAYGSSMCAPKFRQRLGWADVEETKFQEATRPRKCVLKGYRLSFNKPRHAGASQEGQANIVPDPGGVVEGVLYQLSYEAIEFLDKTEVGYVRKEVTVTVDSKELMAQTYIAESTREGLRPEKEYLDLVLEGARAHQLSAAYIQGIENWLVPTVAKVVAAGEV